MAFSTFAMLNDMCLGSSSPLSHILFCVQGLGHPTELPAATFTPGASVSRLCKQEVVIADGSQSFAKLCLWRTQMQWAYSEGMVDRASPLGSPPMPWRVGDLVLLSEARRSPDYGGWRHFQATRSSTTIVLGRECSAGWQLGPACAALAARCTGSASVRLRGLLLQLASSPCRVADTVELWRQRDNVPSASPEGGSSSSSAAAAGAGAAAPSTFQPSLAAGGFTQFLHSGTQAASEPYPYLEVEACGDLEQAAAAAAAQPPGSGSEEPSLEEVERDSLAAMIFQQPSSSPCQWLLLERSGAGAAAAPAPTAASPSLPLPPLLPLPSAQAAIAALLPVQCASCRHPALVDGRGIVTHAACPRSGCSGAAFSRGYGECWVRFAASGQWARCPEAVLTALLGMPPLRLYSALKGEEGREGGGQVLEALQALLQSLVEGGEECPSKWYLEVKTGVGGVFG